MPALYDKLSMFIHLIMAGDRDAVKTIILCRLKMEETCAEMCRRAGLPPAPPADSNGLTVLQLSGEELAAALNCVGKETLQERFWLQRRSRLAKYNIGRCYVSFDESARPCHFQWIYDIRDNEKLAFHFRGEFPVINPEAVILEHALTPVSSRGNGIHTTARRIILDREERIHGIKQFISFINPQNTPAMRSAFRLGFVPVGLRIERWNLFRHSFEFIKSADFRRWSS